MRRRDYLLSLAGVGTLGALGYGAETADEVDVRVWFSERAAATEDLAERVVGYLGRALDGLAGDVDLRVGGTVAVSTEHAYRAMASGEWPRRLVSTVGLDGVVAGADVDLLVTDGDMSRTPTGAGVPGIAAVGGATALARMAPVEETPTVVDYSSRARVSQVLLHECGHALGLRHDHGSVVESAGGAVVSPMVSAYAWAPDRVREAYFDHERSACGHAYPAVSKGTVRLGLVYADCARRAYAERAERFSL